MVRKSKKSPLSELIAAIGSDDFNWLIERALVIISSPPAERKACRKVLVAKIETCAVMKNLRQQATPGQLRNDILAARKALKKAQDAVQTLPKRYADSLIIAGNHLGASIDTREGFYRFTEAMRINAKQIADKLVVNNPKITRFHDPVAVHAANFAYDLLPQPTLTGKGSFIELTEIIINAATGKEPESVETVCRAVWHCIKEDRDITDLYRHRRQT